MYRSAIFSSVIFSSLYITLVQGFAQAKTNVEIGQIARDITLRIEVIDGLEKGSGVLIQKQKNIYTALTAAHVVKNAKSFKLILPDGKVYQSISVSLPKSNLDLAVVKFKSDQTYQIVTIGTSNSLAIGSPISVSGFPASSRTIVDTEFQFTPGVITGIPNKADSSGYSMMYNSITQPGMSGGPVLNESGQLVAIHGKGDQDENGQKTGINLGIIIEKFGLVASSLGVNLKTEIAFRPNSNMKNAADYLLSARAKEDKYDSLGALADYNQAILLNPNFAEAYFNRGNLKVNYYNGIPTETSLNDVSGAMSDFSKAVELNTKFEDAYLARASVRIDKLKDYPGALSDLNQVILLNPKSHSAYNSRGLLKARNLKDITGGVKDINQAISLSMDFHTKAFYWIDLGDIKNDILADFKGALFDYSQAIKFYQSGIKAMNGKLYNTEIVTNAYYKLGILKRDKLNNFLGSLADFDKLIQYNPFADYYYERGVLKQYNLQDTPGAIQDFKEAAKLYKTYSNGSGIQNCINELEKLGIKL
jgi:tetratricopeptide (TPR) repeat protein